MDVTDSGTLFDVDTGEVVRDNKRVKRVRAYAKSVENCVAASAGDSPFRLIANKSGRVITALGSPVISSIDIAFPSCSTASDIDASDRALNEAGATKGLSPAGRALDYAMRTSKSASQWRSSERLLSVFSSALYGGIQIGGDVKPERRAGRVCMDVVSCYPHLATLPLPLVSSAVVERGLRRNASLVYAVGVQHDRALFCRESATVAPSYDEKFAGWYSREEIDYHASFGRVRVDAVVSSCTFSRSDRFLLPTIEHLFDHRERYGRGTPQRGAMKSALNGLLGKFASPISTWRTPSNLELQKARRDRKHTIIQIGASSLINDESLRGIYPRHSNVVWTALVYASARVKLWKKIDELSALGGTVLWAHTDCVIADVPQRSIRTLRYGSALGDWREVVND